MTGRTNSLNDKLEPELVGDARNGDQNAMAELFRRQYPRSIALARRILREREDSLDAVQSAYLSAFQHFQSFRGEAPFEAWITRIVRNQCLMHLREPVQRRAAMSLDQPGRGGTLPIITVDSLTPEDLLLRSELNSVVADATAELPKPLSDVFIRCGISGLSIRDTAEALGLTEPATKTRLFRARCIVRQKLQRKLARPSRDRIKDRLPVVRRNERRIVDVCLP
jgi:RNA polymerase sigma-70 factor (ECF subfamily)